MRSRFLVSFVVAVSSLAFAAAVHAEELPAGVFRMANGSYYQPSTGLITADLSHIVGASASTSTITATTTSDIPATSATTTDVVVPTTFPLLHAIQRAQESLRRHAQTFPAPDSGKTYPTEPDARQVTLAIWNPATDAIRLVTAKKKGTTLTRLSDPIDGIRVTRTNGVNSQFAVKGGEVVVAVQYTIFEERVKGKKKSYTGRDVVYTPYSAALHTPEMVAEGKRWLSATLQQVYTKFRTDDVHSRAFTDKLLADAMDPDLVMSILLIEHIDEHAMAKDAEREVEVMYVTLAANTDDSYDYSKSSAGALGLVQFIPSTYNAIAKWPEVKLEKDFETGMRDPKNALRAETAYLDYLLAHLPDAAKQQYATNRDRVTEYVAAAYNGGVTRVTKAMKVWEENLDPKERTHVLSRSRLKLETMKYVLKLRTLRSALAEKPTLLADASY